MEKKLKFNETLTVEQFKALLHVSRIDVKKSPKTGKLFFTYGAKVGAVAIKGLPKHPMISLVHQTLTREPNAEEMMYIGKSIMVNDKMVSHPKANGFFFILHEEGQGGAPVLASF